MKIIPSPLWVVVRIPRHKHFNDRIDIGGGKEMMVNTTFEPNEHIKIEAEVVGVPNKIRTAPIYQHHEGTPMHMNPSPTGRRTPVYHLYHYDHKFYFGEDFGMDLEKGDIIYYHFNSVSWSGENNESMQETLLGYDDYYELHLIDPTQIFCRKRDGNVVMFFGRVLVDPLKEEMEEIEVAGVKKMAVVNDSLILSTSETMKYLEGIVYNIGEMVGDESRTTISEGDRVLFRKKSEFKNTIDGNEHYVMRQWDIVGKYSNKDYDPVGHFVKIVPIEDEGGLIVPGIVKEMTGIVDLKGESCSNQIETGDVVTFNALTPYFIEYKKNAIFVHERHIHYKHE